MLVPYRCVRLEQKRDWGGGGGGRAAGAKGGGEAEGNERRVNRMIENRQRNQDISVEFVRRGTPPLGFVFLGVFPSFRAPVRPVCVYISLTPPPPPAPPAPPSLFSTVTNLLKLHTVQLLFLRRFSLSPSSLAPRDSLLRPRLPPSPPCRSPRARPTVSLHNVSLSAAFVPRMAYPTEVECKCSPAFLLLSLSIGANETTHNSSCLTKRS